MTQKLPATPVERFLEASIGLAVESIGSEPVQQAIRRRMAARQVADEALYLRVLQDSVDEQQALIESVVVLETWFFRNHATFDYLERYVRSEWLPERGPLRILSLPCATGEEAYSIGMALLEAGLPPENFRIEALDISRQALRVAENGSYGSASFRNPQALAAQAKYFTPEIGNGPGERFRVSERLRRSVQFGQANLLDRRLPEGHPPYHIVFCRNLLIYLTAEARATAVAQLFGLLHEGGLLFVGHAERALVCAGHSGLAQLRQPGVFACRKVSAVPAPLAQMQAQTPLRFERRERRPAKEAAPAPSRAGLVETSPAAGDRRAEPASSPPSATERRRPLDPLAHALDEARRLADQGLLQEALRRCGEVLQHQPDDAQAHFLTGLIHQALGDEAQAEVYFNRTLYLQPHHLEALHYLAFIVERRGDGETAARLRHRLQRLRRHE